MQLRVCMGRLGMRSSLLAMIRDVHLLPLLCGIPGMEFSRDSNAIRSDSEHIRLLAERRSTGCF